MQIDLIKIRNGRSVALKWLVEHLPYCDPFLGNSQAEVLFRRKCFNELTLFLMIQDRFQALNTPDVDTIREFVAAKIADDYLSLAARRSETLLMFTNALAYAVKARILNSHQSNFVRAMLSSKFAWGIDGSAFRYLELLTACHYSGTTGLLSIDDVFKTSALAVALSPIHGSRNAYYALTHAEFYRFLLEYPVNARYQALDIAYQGGMGRFLANQDLDLGLELVIASLLYSGAFEPESVMLLEAAVTSLSTTGLMHTSVDGAATIDFVAAVPNQASWAKAFHVMLVTALALMVAEHFYDENAFLLSTVKRGTAKRLGEGIAAFHKYHIVTGIQKIDGLIDLDESHSRLLQEISAFLLFSRRSDGQFGHLVDELALFHRIKPDAVNSADPSEPIDIACRDFLNSSFGMHFL